MCLFYGYFGVMPKGKLFALGRVSIFAHHNSSYTEVITKLGRLQPAIAAGNIITVGERKTIILSTAVTII